MSRSRPFRGKMKNHVRVCAMIFFAIILFNWSVGFDILFLNVRNVGNPSSKEDYTPRRFVPSNWTLKPLD